MSISSTPRIALETLLATLAGLPTACPTLSELAAVLRISLEQLHEMLAEAGAGGLIELWPAAPDAPRVILSALAAERLGLRLIALSENPLANRWAPAGLPEQDVLRTGSVRTVSEIPEGIDHEQLEPWEILAAAETAEPPPRKPWSGDRAEASLPKPRLLLGLSIPWPVEDRTPCPGCRGRKLSKIAVCLVCHRSGIDHLLPRVKRPRQASQRKRKLKGGLG